jgi:hypothetical protein
MQESLFRYQRVLCYHELCNQIKKLIKHLLLYYKEPIFKVSQTKER